MVFQFGHYTAFDDPGAAFGIENGHVQLSFNVEFDPNQATGLIEMDGITQDIHDESNFNVIQNKYEIRRGGR